MFTNVHQKYGFYGTKSSLISLSSGNALCDCDGLGGEGGGGEVGAAAEQGGDERAGEGGGQAG